jgi:hypothetical protein
MQQKCMICGEVLEEVVCSGRIKDMRISFCDEHSGFCDNCETVVCNVVKE